MAQEDIDPYLSYRLIEPGYEMYRQMGLYQRNLTNFSVQTIYENNRTPDFEDNHCVNCHNYQNYSTRRMLFHVRAAHGGTIVADQNGIRRMALRGDSILATAVYPTWHPTKNLVVFSTNLTGQAFHTLDRQKVEVVDEASDLIFYDADRGEIRNIFKTRATLENFPCWSPDGRRVYYCAATLPQLRQVSDSLRGSAVIEGYDSIRYNLMCVDYDERTQTFSHPRVIMDCAAIGKSASVPRVSPDAATCSLRWLITGSFISGTSRPTCMSRTSPPAAFTRLRQPTARMLTVITLGAATAAGLCSAPAVTMVPTPVPTLPILTATGRHTALSSCRRMTPKATSCS